jgi:hypothetical protein
MHDLPTHQLLNCAPTDPGSTIPALVTLTAVLVPALRYSFSLPDLLYVYREEQSR